MKTKHLNPDIRYRMMIVVTGLSIILLTVSAIWQCRLVIRQIESVKNDTYIANISGKQRYYSLKFFFVLYQMITNPEYRLTDKSREAMESDLKIFMRNHESFIEKRPRDDVESGSKEINRLLYDPPYEFDKKHKAFEERFSKVLAEKNYLETHQNRLEVQHLLNEAYELIQSKDRLTEQYITDSQMRYGKIYSQMFMAGILFLLILAVMALFGVVPMRKRIRKQMHHLKHHAEMLEMRNKELEELRDIILSILQDAQLGRKRAETAEHSIKEYAHKLEYSNQELENFAHVASHDLKEPLRKIKVFGDMLTQDISNVFTEKQKDYIQRMQNSAERMQQLIDGLLDYSSVTHTAPKMEWVDLNQIIEGVLSDFDIKIQEIKAKIKVEELPIIEADRLRMRQLFQNILSNALKYRSKDRDPEIRIWAENTDEKWVEVHVEDNGIGLDQVHAEKIFKPFERLHGRKDYEGSGIGLAICKRIAMSLGGDITAKGKLGFGSKFTVKLRASKA